MRTGDKDKAARGDASGLEVEAGSKGTELLRESSGHERPVSGLSASHMPRVFLAADQGAARSLVGLPLTTPVTIDVS